MTIDTVIGKVERIAEGGNLLANLEFLQDINTWETSQEVWQAWQRGAPVKGVSTANLGVYRLVDGEAVFDLLGREGNPFLDSRFREEAYHGIIDLEFFSLQGEMKEQVLSAIKAKQSATIKYSGLNLKTGDCSPSQGYIEAGNDNTAEEKKLFSIVYGTDNPGEGRKIYLLREEVVKAQLQQRGEDFVAKACCLGDDQDFSAGGRLINLYYNAICGVRRVDVAAGDAVKKEVPQEINFADHYQAILDHYEEAIKAMDDKVAIGFSRLVAGYLATKASQSS